MKSLSCFHCGAEVTNGLALCETCQAGARVYLEFVPVYFRNLARWKPGRAGSRPVPGSRIPPGVQLEAPRPGTGDRISDRLDEVLSDLVGWARMLHDERGINLDEAETPAEQAESICHALTEHLTSISTTDWCGDLVRQMALNERTLRGLTEEYVPGWYAGGCESCGYGTYVVPGLTWVTCANVECGVTTYARDHLETILDEARGWVAPPKRLAEAVVALVDTEVSVGRLHERIKKWGQRDKVGTVRRLDADGDECGPKRHRLGEVMDMIRNEGSTRIVPSATAKAS